ncbi:hypothetical protein D9M72_479040 [compost metagenome]
MTDVGAVGFAKTLLDEAFEDGPLLVAGQSPEETHWRCFGLAEIQRQLHIPVEFGHEKNTSPGSIGRSIKGIS